MDHSANVRDVSWAMSNQSEFKAACLALSRNDLAALKSAFNLTYSFLGAREFNRFVSATPEDTALGKFIRG